MSHAPPSVVSSRARRTELPPSGDAPPPGVPAGHAATRSGARATREPPAVRMALIAFALGFLGLFVVMPVGVVFAGALEQGLGAYVAAITTRETLAAVQLTLIAAGIAVPVNVVFGLAAAWLVAKFRFPGRGLLLAVIDLPFSVSPVISGLVFVLLFGRRGYFGPVLADLDVKIIYAVPGIVLATVFVTAPFVAREVLAVMQVQGSDEEEAALTLGASGWQMFTRVTLPKVKWGLLFGVVLCNARAMGEFGAVSVVSGHVRGVTETLPLHVEILYNEYDHVGAFASASLLTLLAFATLGAKRWVESRRAD